ncbi:MAG: endonuclease MutS2 [Chloroflexi bacterium]|jgi:DNA mismatch repair protein MutS2|nr:endonuclease MutS2 [Chloroflexota bacterium]HOE34903.1 endonuclease MutS2 [Anaerolineaceae bacterium]HOT26302.1 endonuclease MutS2 [Anaerolineaceae bacterium]HQK03868.1 endonuclease MutS2 [Anaerolineaceae bacterium]
MNPKSLILLEYPKILAKLKSYASFSASAALADSLRPTSSLEKALAMQQLTREARYLLSMNNELNFSGAVDMRPLVDLTLRSVTLEALDLLAIRSTLIISRTARRVLENHREDAPRMAELAEGLTDGLGLIDLISRTISDRGEVMDSASEALGRIRSEIKVSHARLMERLSRYINDPESARMLQEPIITQRGGRYVLPLRAEFKGRIKAIVHDQSASGATLFIEPIAVVEWNNKVRELELQERDEVLRVLHALSLRIAEQAESLKLSVEAMAALDLALMKARYAEDLRAVEPELVPFAEKAPEFHPGSVIALRRARHPLLDPAKVVPIDVVLDEQTFSVVLTGPNTGGKTVSLKTVGLLVLMAQSGMQIPAQSGSRLSLFRDVFADIGDEQSIEQSLSTFSGHISQLVRIIKRADYRSLVLLDELGAGTDPQEGSALARAVLTYLLSRRITNIVATHYPELKTFAHATKGVINASLEFDLDTLKPTYHLILGLPGRSNALAIAERLGLPKAIVDDARAELNPLDLRAEDLLDEIHRQRDLTRLNYEESEKLRRELEEQRAKLNARLSQLEEQKADILEKTQRKAEEELAALRAELNELRRNMVKKNEPLAEMEALQEKLEQVEIRQEKAARKKRQPKPKLEQGPLKPGERVMVRKLKTEGLVTSADAEEIEVQVGMLRMRLKPQEVERKAAPELSEPSEAPKPAVGKTQLPSVASPGLELDLRGMRVEDALDKLDAYLEQGYLSGLPFGRIIHGKGTGALRQAVRDVLQHSPQVRRWESGGEKEGGDGVSVVFFESQ